MWVATVTLLSLLAALGYLALAARKLDAKLDALLQKQCKERGHLAQELDRVRATVVPGC
jgi:hypothetical protein